MASTLFILDEQPYGGERSYHGARPLAGRDVICADPAPATRLKPPSPWLRRCRIAYGKFWPWSKS